MKQKFKLYLFLQKKYYVITESLKVGRWLSEFEFKEKTTFPPHRHLPFVKQKLLDSRNQYLT